MNFWSSPVVLKAVGLLPSSLHRSSCLKTTNCSPSAWGSPEIDKVFTESEITFVPSFKDLKLKEHWKFTQKAKTVSKAASYHILAALQQLPLGWNLSTDRSSCLWSPWKGQDPSHRWFQWQLLPQRPKSSSPPWPEIAQRSQLVLSLLTKLLVLLWTSTACNRAGWCFSCLCCFNANWLLTRQGFVLVRRYVICVIPSSNFFPPKISHLAFAKGNHLIILFLYFFFLCLFFTQYRRFSMWEYY